MKSFDDELNDAIRNALKGPLGNFERKPKASLDERIYRELGQTSNRKPLWAVLSLAAVIGLLGLWYVNDSKINGVTEKTIHASGKLATRGPAQKVQPVYKKDELGKSKRVAEIAAKAPLNPAPDDRILPKNRMAASPQSALKPERKLKPSASEMPFSEPATGTETGEHYLAGDNAAGIRSGDPGHVFDNKNHADHIKELEFLNASKYPTLPMPQVTVPMSQSRADSSGQDIAVKKPADSWKPAMLVYVSATNTSQSVYLLPSAHSRILKVSFPNSIANIGYKVGFGMQAKGYQLLINYSHLQYQTEYVYGLEEFTAEPANASYNFKRLGAARTVKSAFDIVGMAAKKNVDFETRALGALYAQLGMEYSRSVMGPDQQLLSASLSAGKRIFASPKATIVIGPFFEYNILRIPTSEENVKIRPNQVGISLGLKFAN